MRPKPQKEAELMDVDDSDISEDEEGKKLWLFNNATSLPGKNYNRIN